MADEIDCVNGIDVMGSRPVLRVAHALKNKKRASKKRDPDKDQGTHAPETLPALLRHRMIVALSQTLSHKSDRMIGWLANIVEAKVNLSRANPAFPGFNAEYQPSGWTFNSTYLQRKPRAISKAATLQERHGFQFTAMFAGSTLIENEFFPDEPMNIEAMRYPSARHLFFLAETVAHMEGWVTEESEAISLTIDDNRKDYGISVMRVADSVVDRFNDARWADFQVSTDRPHFDECNSVGDRQIEQLDLLHTELNPQTIIPLTVETILEGPAKITDYIVNIIGQRVSCLTSTRNRNRVGKHQLCSMTNIAIEGIHWNTHRREEIEHLIVTSDLTRREQLAAYFYEVENFENRVHTLKANLSNADEVSPYTFNDLDGFPEGIIVENLAFAVTGLDLQAVLMAHAAETRETPEQMRKTAVHNAAQHKRQEFEEAVERATRLRRDLLEAELDVHRMRLVYQAYERDIAGVIDRLEARLGEMELLENVQLSPSLKFMVTTGDVYAEPHHDEDDDSDEGETPLPTYNLSHRRYVGKYQIIFDPLDGSMHARNIAAVMACEGTRMHRTTLVKGRSTTQPTNACAVFHPHASVNGDFLSTSVCLGSYDTDIGRTLRRIEASKIEDVVLGQLRTFLLFLQTYSINDTYVRNLIGAMPETKPTEERALGITAWQNISGDDKTTPVVEGFVFDKNAGPRRVATSYVVDKKLFMLPSLVDREPKNKLERYWPYKTKDMAIPYSWLLNRNDPEVMELQIEMERRDQEAQMEAAKRRQEERENRRAASTARRMSTLELIEIRRANAIAAERMASGEMNDEFGLNDECDDGPPEAPTDEASQDLATSMAILVEASVNMNSPTPAFAATNGSDASEFNLQEGEAA